MPHADVDKGISGCGASAGEGRAGGGIGGSLEASISGRSVAAALDRNPKRFFPTAGLPKYGKGASGLDAPVRWCSVVRIVVRFVPSCVVPSSIPCRPWRSSQSHSSSSSLGYGASAKAMLWLLAALALQATGLQVNSSPACRFCRRTFDSRNAVYRHLREADACSAAAAAEDPRSTAAIFSERKTHTATLLVGYGAGRGATAEAALASLCGATSVTRAAAAHGRSAALGLGDAAAARDVISVSADWPIPDVDRLNADLPKDVRVLGSRPGRVHAEAAASQRAFHYLLPLRWLEGGDAVVTKSSTVPGRYGVRAPVHTARAGGSGIDPRARTALRGLKAALRGAAATSGAWHNFADPALRGLLSPFSSVTRTTLHRVRAAEIVDVGGEVRNCRGVSPRCRRTPHPARPH